MQFSRQLIGMAKASGLVRSMSTSALRPLSQVLSEVASTQRVLLKLGTAVLTRDDECGIALGRLASIAEQAAELQNSGRNVILVTSGSVGFGKMLLREQKMMSTPMGAFRRGKDWNPDARAAAAIGQPSLMALYQSLFSQYGVRCAQVLVTQNDFERTSTRDNLTSTVEELLRLNIIPLVNENDVMSDPATADGDLEGTISLKDNDSLAALLAVQLHAKAMVCLSDVDGVYTAPPGSAGARLLDSYNPEHTGKSIEFGKKSSVGRGGMEAKLGAALFAARKGIHVVIANGFKPNVVLDVFQGRGEGTLISTAVNPGGTHAESSCFNGQVENLDLGLDYANGSSVQPHAA